MVAVADMLCSSHLYVTHSQTEGGQITWSPSVLHFLYMSVVFAYHYVRQSAFQCTLWQVSVHKGGPK